LTGGLQSNDKKSKCSAAGRRFIAVAAGNRHDETAVLRTVDRDCRVSAKETGNIDVARLH
jgi:hypothetical protein